LEENAMWAGVFARQKQQSQTLGVGSCRLTKFPDRIGAVVVRNPKHSRVSALLRIATWICIFLLAVLSLLPAKNMPETGLPDFINHFIAYAGSAAIAIAGFRKQRTDGWMIIAAICGYAAILEYLQQFAPGRDPGLDDFVASAIGAIVGGAVSAFVWPRLLRWFLPPPRAGIADRGMPAKP
jgi:VanZ family protein